MNDVAIRVEGLGKQYRLGGARESYSTLRDQFRKWTSLRGLLRRANHTEKQPPFWALKDVSFEVKQGEVVGIIGRNGAGKSTLLKILSRITEPTEGGADIHGRVGSLLEVGTGFHPELSGRENVYLNGAILGMRRTEIAKKFDEIVEFAEVSRFIDTSVKHYSSGMYMRLAFAVAAHLEPEILIVDEVLAVGDIQFQRKCIGKMGDVARGGRTVIFVSHNIDAIEKLCQTTIQLNEGKVEAIGSTSEIVRRYLSTCHKTIPRDISARPLIDDLNLQNLKLLPDILVSGENLSISVGISSPTGSTIQSLCLLVYTMTETRVAIIDLRHPDGSYRLPAGKTVTFEIEVQGLNLVEGNYKIGLYIQSDSEDKNILDLSVLQVLPRYDGRPNVPYAAMHRGLVELNCSAVHTWTK